MNTLDFDDVTNTVEGLTKNVDISKSQYDLNYQLNNLVSSLSALTHGLSLTYASYNSNISFDQDIFSSLPRKVFDTTFNEQLAEFMLSLRNEFYKNIINYPQKILPKFIYFYDEEESVENIRLSSEWTDGNAMVYFSFEKEKTESSFGLIWNDTKGKNYQSRSGNIYLNSKEDIIHESIDFILRVY